MPGDFLDPVRRSLPRVVLKSAGKQPRDGVHMARRRESLIERLLVLPSWIRSLLVARSFDQQSDLENVRSLTWRQFESVVGEGFRRRGYGVIENARDGADGGIDLTLYKNGACFLVQCKQWKRSTVGVKPVRELLGVVSARDAAGGFFVTSGSYTDEARAFAKNTSIELLDGPALAELVLDARRPEPFLDPTEGRRRTSADPIAEPTCPKCHGAMVRRTAARGANAGREFWGCLQFPLCRGTVDILSLD
jgi:restriction system protein